MPVIGMAGGFSINSDGVEEQRAFGVIAYNDLRPPLLISQTLIVRTRIRSIISEPLLIHIAGLYLV